MILEKLSSQYGLSAQVLTLEAALALGIAILTILATTQSMLVVSPKGWVDANLYKVASDMLLVLDKSKILEGSAEDILDFLNGTLNNNTYAILRIYLPNSTIAIRKPQNATILVTSKFVVAKRMIYINNSLAIAELKLWIKEI